MYKYFTWILLITFVAGCEQQNHEEQTLILDVQVFSGEKNHCDKIIKMIIS